MMMAFGPADSAILPHRDVTPETTYILINWDDHNRRIFTDGRDWPQELEPTFAGYSIGKWIDEDGDGRYDVLQVETRNFKGPRAPRQSVIDHGHFVVQKLRVCFVEVDPLLENRLIIESERQTGRIIGRGQSTRNICAIQIPVRSGLNIIAARTTGKFRSARRTTS
jgi:hypothetical protein